MFVATTIHNNKKPYPYLAIHKNDLGSDTPLIVMFIQQDKAVDMTNQIGDVLMTAEENYVTYNGALTVSNYPL